jgi:hypothetical protein
MCVIICSDKGITTFPSPYGYWGHKIIAIYVPDNRIIDIESETLQEWHVLKYTDLRGNPLSQKSCELLQRIKEQTNFVYDSDVCFFIPYTEGVTTELGIKKPTEYSDSGLIIKSTEHTHTVKSDEPDTYMDMDISSVTFVGTDSPVSFGETSKTQTEGWLISVTITEMSEEVKGVTTEAMGL